MARRPHPSNEAAQIKSGGVSVDPPRTVFDDLVNLSVRTPANWIDRHFPLDLRLEVDEHCLVVQPRAGMLRKIVETLQLTEPEAPAPLRLVIRLRHCYVRADCDGVSIASESKYRSAVEIGGFTEQHVNAANESRATSSRLQAGAAASLASVASAGLAAAAGRSNLRSAAMSVEHVIAASRDLYEVEAVPGGWRIGDRAQGDPLKRDGCLDGQYFGKPVDRYPHTCTVEFDAGRTNATMHLRVTTRDGLYVQRADGHAAAHRDRPLAEQAMRDRLAAIRVESELEPDEPVANQEITVFSLRCVCVAAGPVETGTAS